MRGYTGGRSKMAGTAQSAAPSRPAANLPVRGLRALILPIISTGSLWLLRTNDTSFLAIACSFLLALYVVIAYFRWREYRSRTAVPVFPMVAAMFWLCFVPPLFWGSETLSGAAGERYLPRNSIDTAMLAAVLGVTAMFIGYSVRVGQRGKAREVLLLRPTVNSHTYLWLITLCGLVGLRFVSPVVNLVGAGFRQPVEIAVQFTPTATFLLLVLEFLAGRATYIDRVGIPLYLAARLAVGLASGWLGPAIMTLLVVALAFAMKLRRLPIAPLVAALLAIIYLQPGKEAFRTRFWYGDETASVSTRITGWLSESNRLWKDALVGQSGEEWRDLGMRTVSRFDLLHQAANVIDYTPAVVPYQHGRLYSYLWVTYIPRFMWPSKPSVNDANRWYQVAYGLTDPENLDAVSIACGFLTESYISFGWIGIPVLMFLIGVFIDFFERMLLSRSSGMYFNALGLALIPQLMTIESQLGQYIAGILQTVALTTVLLLPILVWRRAAERRAAGVRALAPASLRQQTRQAANPAFPA